MRTKEFTFESTMDRFHEIVERIFPLLQEEPKIALNQFSDEIYKTGGKPQPNSSWNDRANVRYGYQNDIPGILSETIAMMRLAPQGSDKVIKNAYDKHTQLGCQIDFFVDEVSYQCKTIRFTPRVLIVNDYVKVGKFGAPDYICLVDIDDRTCIIVPRLILTEFVGKFLYRSDLESIDAQIFNNEGKY